MTECDRPTADPRPLDDTDFDEAIALRPVGDGRLAATIRPGWDVRGVPHGGYLLALVAAAAQTVVPQPHPLSVSATYLAPPEFGSAEITVEVARAGRRQSTVTARLTQGDLERVRATVTLGTLLDAGTELLAADARPPDGPELEHCRPMGHGEGEAPALHRRVEIRLSPETGFDIGRPSGRPELDGWIRLAGGRPADPLALLLFSDGFPPSIFEARGVAIGHVPTVQLTTHLFALPGPGWVRARFRTRVQGGSFVDEDGELWDGDGRLVATARQLALVR